MSGEQRTFNPLHRVVGAAVLVAAVVVFVPMIVQPRRPAGLPATPVPSFAAPALKPPSASGGEPKAQRPTVPPVTALPHRQSVPALAPTVAVVPRVVHPATPKPAHAPKMRVALATRSPWYVQVASFTKPGDARRLAARLRHAGFPAQVRRHGPRLFRVRVGPYRSTQAAQLAQALLRRTWRVHTWVRRAAK